MKWRASCLLMAALPLACGIVTGLNDDYTFTSGGGVDASASDGATDGGADAATPAEAGADAGACALSTTVVPVACRTCLESACCTLAACAGSATCSAYARCRIDCSGVARETCVKQCESKASGNTKDLLSAAVQACSLPQACRNTCNLP